jgi:hypothetical protein
LLPLWIGTGGSAAAQSVERIFSTANEAFFQGDYARASEGYEQLLSGGKFSEKLFKIPASCCKCSLAGDSSQIDIVKFLQFKSGSP